AAEGEDRGLRERERGQLPAFERSAPRVEDRGRVGEASREREERRLVAEELEETVERGRAALRVEEPLEEGADAAVPRFAGIGREALHGLAAELGREARRDRIVARGAERGERATDVAFAEAQHGHREREPGALGARTTRVLEGERVDERRAVTAEADEIGGHERGREGRIAAIAGLGEGADLGVDGARGDAR